MGHMRRMHACPRMTYALVEGRLESGVLVHSHGHLMPVASTSFVPPRLHEVPLPSHKIDWVPTLRRVAEEGVVVIPRLADGAEVVARFVGAQLHQHVVVAAAPEGVRCGDPGYQEGRHAVHVVIRDVGWRQQLRVQQEHGVGLVSQRILLRPLHGAVVVAWWAIVPLNQHATTTGEPVG